MKINLHIPKSRFIFVSSNQQQMSAIRKNGYTYQQIQKVSSKGKKYFECIKWVTGYRNLWERISLDEYNEVTKNLTK